MAYLASLFGISNQKSASDEAASGASEESGGTNSDPLAHHYEEQRPGGEHAKLDRLADDMQRARLEKLFHSLDQNRDGKIDPDELERGLERMGYAHVSKDNIKVRYTERCGLRTLLPPVLVEEMVASVAASVAASFLFLVFLVFSSSNLSLRFLLCW